MSSQDEALLLAPLARQPLHLQAILRSSPLHRCRGRKHLHSSTDWLSTHKISHWWIMALTLPRRIWVFVHTTPWKQISLCILHKLQIRATPEILTTDFLLSTHHRAAKSDILQGIWKLKISTIVLQTSFATRQSNNRCSVDLFIFLKRGLFSKTVRSMRRCSFCRAAEAMELLCGLILAQSVRCNKLVINSRQCWSHWDNDRWRHIFGSSCSNLRRLLSPHLWIPAKYFWTLL